MRKVYIVCGRRVESLAEYWILGVYASQKRAQSMCFYMNKDSNLFVYFVKSFSLL